MKQELNQRADWDTNAVRWSTNYMYLEGTHADSKLQDAVKNTWSCFFSQTVHTEMLV